MNNYYIKDGANRCKTNGNIEAYGQRECEHSFPFYEIAKVRCVHYSNDECHCYSAIEAAGRGEDE